VNGWQRAHQPRVAIESRPITTQRKYQGYIYAYVYKRNFETDWITRSITSKMRLCAVCNSAVASEGEQEGAMTCPYCGESSWLPGEIDTSVAAALDKLGSSNEAEGAVISAVENARTRARKSER